MNVPPINNVERLDRFYYIKSADKDGAAVGAVIERLISRTGTTFFVVSTDNYRYGENFTELKFMC